MNQAKWDQRWMQLADTAASWSEDRSRRVGAVIVNSNQAVVSLGWNGFPRRVKGTELRHQRPAKYLWTEHAERNAFYNAASIGVSTMGCTLYTTLYPCADCARGIIQSGISQVVSPQPDWADAKYAADFAVTSEMLREASVLVRFVDTVGTIQGGAVPPPVRPNAALDMNVGHGHIFPRPDGYKAECGGRAMCGICQADAKLKATGLGQ